MHYDTQLVIGRAGPGRIWLRHRRPAQATGSVRCGHPTPSRGDMCQKVALRASAAAQPATLRDRRQAGCGRFVA